MSDNTHSIGGNILILRHRIKMTQAEFIDMFLKKGDGKPMFSVAKLSNLETKGGKDEERVAQVIAERLGLDASVFQMDPVEFERHVDDFLDHARADRVMVPLHPERYTMGKTTYSGSVLEALSDYLAENITSGRLHAGDRLPGDRTLAELTGVSRSAVREALKVLGAIGVVNILPGSGVYLAKNTREIFTLPFSWTILLSKDSNQDIYQLRTLIERETVRLATEKRKESSFTPIRIAIAREARMLKSENYAEMYRCDTDFHMNIAYCAGNDVLTDLLVTCRKILSFLNAMGMSTAPQIQEMHCEHEALFKAMEQGESETAQRLVEEHMQRSAMRYMGRK